MAARTLYAVVQRIGRWTYRYYVRETGTLGDFTFQSGTRLGRRWAAWAAHRALARHVAKRERDAAYRADRTVMDS